MLDEASRSGAQTRGLGTIERSRLICEAVTGNLSEVAMPQRCAVVVALAMSMLVTLHAQKSSSTVAVAMPIKHLRLAQLKVVKAEAAGMFALPAKCDSAGNIYFRTGVRPSEIRKIDQSSLQGSTFPSSPVPDMRYGPSYFAVDDEGRVSQIVSFGHEVSPSIAHFKSDGTLQSRTKLDAGAGTRWKVRQIASFPSGTFLVSGTVAREAVDEESQLEEPLTAIVSPDGTVLREVNLSDDRRLRAEVERKKKGAWSKQFPQAILAVDFGSAEAGPDGNVYLMRQTVPALIYAISPGGEVIRRFEVEPKGISLKYGPLSVRAPLHISGNRMSVLFGDNSGTQIIMVVSLSGEHLAAYLPPQGYESPGAVLACYSADKEEFTFLGSDDDGALALKVYEPR